MWTLRDFQHFAQGHFRLATPIQHVFASFAVFIASTPLFRLHWVQTTATNRRRTAWITAVETFMGTVTDREAESYPGASPEDMPDVDKRQTLLNRLPALADDLSVGLPMDSPSVPSIVHEMDLPTLMITNRTRCLYCVLPGANALHKPLRSQDGGIQEVFLITVTYSRTVAQLGVAVCEQCETRYYPDRIVRRRQDGAFQQFYIADAQYLRISKSARLWIHRSIAEAQAQAILQHQTFSGYAAWYNKTYGPNGSVNYNRPATGVPQTMTEEQLYRMFVEHMVRLLGSAAGVDGQVFHTAFNPTTEEVVRAACGWFVRDGVLPGALQHSCENCTHPKRYFPTGEARDQTFGVVGDADDVGPGNLPAVEDDDNHALDVMEGERVQQRDDGEPRVVRMAVLDGKVVGHMVCYFL